MVDGDRDGPSPEVDGDTQSAIKTLFLLEQQLNAARSLPGRDVVLRVMADGGGLLSCFVRVSSRDPTAAAELVLAYASWCAAGMGPSHDPRPLAVGGRPLVDIVAEGAGTSQAPVAVVRDVRILGALLQQFSFDQVLRSHVAKLQRTMLASLPAQRHGLSMVQDLRELSLALVARMMDPRMLLAQA